LDKIGRVTSSQWFHYSNASILVMGPGQILLTWVGSFFCCLGWVGSGFVSLWVWKIFLQKYQILQFFSLEVKKNLSRSGLKISRLQMSQPLIYSGTKVCLGWVGSGQGASLYHCGFVFVFCICILLNSFISYCNKCMKLYKS